MRHQWVFAVVIGFVNAQLGLFDLQADDDTKFIGSTQAVLPNCFSMPNGFCGDGGRTVFIPDAQFPGLLGWYDFDDALGLDKSGNANHPLLPPPNVGPGHDGRGQSAYFSGVDSFVIPNVDAFTNLRELTVSFWIYLLTGPSESWRIVFRKGDTIGDLTPTLMLFPDSNKLHFKVSTSDPSKDGLDSMTAIPMRRWTHVAVALNFNTVAMFINGVKNSEGPLTGHIALNTGSWHVGKDLFLPGTGMFLDNFKIFNSALGESALQVEASAALPGLGPNFLRLGCASCDMRTAIEACASSGGYHLCRSLELSGGGLMVARAMGFLGMASDQWSAEDQEPSIGLDKLGLCCLD